MQFYTCHHLKKKKTLKYFDQKRQKIYTDSQTSPGSCRLGASCFHSALSLASQLGSHLLQCRMQPLRKQEKDLSSEETKKGGELWG